MKTRLLLILFVAAAMAIAALYVRQSRRLASNQSQLASLHREVERKADEVHELEIAREHLNRRRQEAEQQAQALQAALRQTNANSPAVTPSPGASSTPNPGRPQGSPSEGFGKMFAQMMEDPATRKFIRDQQRLVLDQLYAPLVKQLGLTSEEADKFKDLLAETSMRGAEKATSLMGGTTNTNRQETLTALAAEQKDAEEAMRSLLGDERFQQYKEYQKTAAERMQLNLFKQQASGEAAINEQQTEQLLALISEEKKGLAAAGQVFPTGEAPGEQLNTVLSEDKTEQLLQSQEALNQRVRDRAQDLLTPPQMEAFARFQTNQMQMMRVGMTMARKMFANPEPTPARAQP